MTRLAFDSLNAERIKTSEEARILAHQNSNLQITVNWLLHRVNQLEKERAHLLLQYVGIKMEVPSIEPADPDPNEVLGGANIFQDVGDDAAKRLGLDWDERGMLKQN